MSNFKRIRDLRRDFNQQTVKQVEALEIEAQIGKVRSDGSVSVRGSTSNNDLLEYPFIYIRINGSENETRVCSAVNVGWKANNWLIVKRTKDGYVALRAADRKSADFLGESAGGLSQPPIRGDVDKSLIVDSQNFIPGRLQLTSDSTGLKVTLAPFWYTDSAAALHKWRGELSGSVTRTMPSAGTHRWSLLEFDPDTAALNVQAGTSYSVAFPIQSDSERIGVIEAFTVSDGYLPCWAIYERGGMTAIDFENGIEDVRLWLSTQTQGGGGVTGVQMYDDNFAPMFDDAGYPIFTDS